MKTVLITSIPPIANDQKFGERLSYQKRCIASWMACGHEPHSLNVEEELGQLAPLFPEVFFHPAYRSTAPINRRNLVYLADAVALGLETSSERIAICNADVFFDPLIPFTQALPLDLLLAYSHRIDIDRVDQPTHAKPFFGIDYVNLSQAFASELTDNIFALGLPWWDYWLPLEALRKGSTPINLTWNRQPLLRHLIHGDRWDPSSLVYLGRHLLNLVSTGIDHSQINLHQITSSWQRFNDSFSGIMVNPTTEIFARIARDLCRHIQENSMTHEFRRA